MTKVFSVFYVIVSICILYLLYVLYSEFLTTNINFYKYFFIGFIALFILVRFINHSRYKFLDTYFHEKSHIVFAYLTFATPQTLMVSPSNPQDGANGYVQYSFEKSRIMGIVRSYLVSLAPYFFSPLAFVYFCIYWVVVPTDGFIMEGITTSQTTINIILLLCGFFYAYNLRTSFAQAKPYQTDFSDVGYKDGVIFVVFMQLLFLLFYSLILFSNHDSFSFLYEYVLDTFSNIDIENMLFDIKIFIFQKFGVWLNI